MTRPFRQQVDESILDQAAALFARRGVAKTSVQEVADAVGLSKTGLLHHFPSKDALHEAVVAQAVSLGERVLAQVRHLPAGVDRDRSAIEVLVDVAFAHPGLVAMLLTPVMQGSSDAIKPADGGIGGAAFEAFGLDPLTPVTERSVRVAGALVVLAVLGLAAHRSDQVATWRPHIIATCFDALGHGRPGASRSDSDQVED
ncbi:TetR/AcrR family transcriptional regulator [Umezawaea endophytica]|uniref:TetR/AcrR family transcriptional regulator n=1 Tax=Umezawaea endophytica TaxID=1654476 RepID=A0A9X3ADX8_9PSEU|nr:TetR/AcrR family transcriptional regulator [Umezawaea endophytica]MCS7475335.1 TetR/AcrR family transcriptional regulator [Umezawaea endophytica]